MQRLMHFENSHPNTSHSLTQFNYPENECRIKNFDTQLSAAFMKTYILPSNWSSISCQMNHEVVTAWGNIFDMRALLETRLWERVRTRETKREEYTMKIDIVKDIFC